MDEKLKIIYKNVDELIPYENNPRNNDAAVPMVAESIKDFGFKIPIVIDSDNVIVAGHTRLKAAKMLKLDSVPCIVADDLTEEQAKAFRLVDNKTAELAEWNFEKLEIELDGLDDVFINDFDFGSFAFDDEPELYGDEEIDLNAQPEREEIECPNCSFRFEI